MGKTYLKSLYMIARSSNFTDYKHPDGREFDYGDEKSAENLLYSNMRADSALLQLLKGMSDRDKIILLYQVLREAGYNLNHSDCASTLCITRERYMVLLREVRQRASKIVASAIEE